VTGHRAARRFAWPIAFAAIAVTLAARADDAPPANPPAAASQGGGQSSEIGRSILVINDVDGQSGDAAPRRIAVNDDIVFAEDITTGDDAKTVIEFRDGSTFEIGPDAAIRIDSFIFNPEESTGHKAVTVSRGVFRYVSGFVASDQEAKIATPAGEMGIRGSVVEGVIDPGVPDFVYVGEGNATFTNSAGSSTVEAGGAIAVPSAATPPMAPGAMPPAVAAQAVGVIEQRLPPRAAVQNRPAAADAWLKQAGAADLVPAAEQRQHEAAAAARPPPASLGRGSLAGQLGLLVQGNQVGLFRGGQNPRTPEQTAFLAQAARENPRADAIMQRHRIDAEAMHRASMAAGTALVIHGVGRAAPSAEAMRRVTAAAIRANPGAAAAINRHAEEANRARERGDITRHEGTALSHPQEQRAGPRPPPQNREQHANPQNRVPQQRNVGPKPPPRRQGPAKPPPRRKKDENQR
jgi:hypothetical protein